MKRYPGQKILITGSSGAMGRELQQSLTSTPYTVISTSRNKREKYYLDVTDYDNVYSCLQQTRSDLVFHLAAIVPIPTVERDQGRAFTTNVLGLNNVLRAVEKLKIATRIIIASSGEVYGNGFINRKFAETDLFSPNNFYAFTKVAQEELAHLYMKKGLDIRIARVFNYSSIYKRPIYSVESFADQIARLISRSEHAKIAVGNLIPERDFLQGRDVAKALIQTAIQSSEFHTFNICRGETVSMRKLLDLVIQHFGAHVDIMEDKNKYREIENVYLCGDNERIRSLGWRPEISINEMVEILVRHYKKLYCI